MGKKFFLMIIYIYVCVYNAQLFYFKNQISFNLKTMEFPSGMCVCVCVLKWFGNYLFYLEMQNYKKDTSGIK